MEKSVLFPSEMQPTPRAGFNGKANSVTDGQKEIHEEKLVPRVVWSASYFILFWGLVSSLLLGAVVGDFVCASVGIC